jgi:hypothetical protein
MDVQKPFPIEPDPAEWSGVEYRHSTSTTLPAVGAQDKWQATSEGRVGYLVVKKSPGKYRIRAWVKVSGQDSEVVVVDKVHETPTAIGAQQALVNFAAAALQRLADAARAFAGTALLLVLALPAYAGQPPTVAELRAAEYQRVMQVAAGPAPRQASSIAGPRRTWYRGSGVDLGTTVLSLVAGNREGGVPGLVSQHPVAVVGVSLALTIAAERVATYYHHRNPSDPTPRRFLRWGGWARGVGLGAWNTVQLVRALRR